MDNLKSSTAFFALLMVLRVHISLKYFIAYVTSYQMFSKAIISYNSG